jgi:hypothetical protein
MLSYPFIRIYLIGGLDLFYILLKDGGGNICMGKGENVKEKGRIEGENRNK